jgi:hypothetical protein
MEEISMQLDYWTAASEAAAMTKRSPPQDMAARVSNKIERLASACAMWKKSSPP